MSRKNGNRTGRSEIKGARERATADRASPDATPGAFGAAADNEPSRNSGGEARRNSRYPL
ncbi:MAG: hypothetical protein V1867_02230 [Candidatus Falkowbacteria bacterium]